MMISHIQGKSTTVSLKKWEAGIQRLAYGRHVVFFTDMIPSLSFLNVMTISQCSDFKMVSNGSRISSLSLMMAQPPGLKIRSISTTIVTGCLHLHNTRVALSRTIIGFPGNINKAYVKACLRYRVGTLRIHYRYIVFQEMDEIQNK